MKMVRMLRVSILMFLSVTAFAMHHDCPSRSKRNQLSFDEMEEMGCLPEDFAMPQDAKELMDHCWESSKRYKRGTGMIQKMKGMMRIRPALSCLVKKLNLTNEEGFDMDKMMMFIDAWSMNTSWTQKQKEHMQLCQTIMEKSFMRENQGIYMMTCYRGMAMLDCGRHKAQTMGGNSAVNLVNMMASKCMDAVKPSRTTMQAWGICSAKEDLDMSMIDELLEEAMEGDEGLDDEDRKQMDDVVVKTKKVAACTMQRTGEANNNKVDYDAVKKQISMAEAPDWAKTMRVAVVEECRKLGADTVNDMLECWWQISPLACIGAESHMMAEGIGMMMGGMGGMGGMGSMGGMGGMQGSGGMQGMGGMRFMGGMQGNGGMYGMQAMRGMASMQGMGGMGGMGRMGGMGGMQGMGRMGAMQGIHGMMHNMGHMHVMGHTHGVGGMDRSGGMYGTSGMQGASGMQRASGMHGASGMQRASGMHGTDSMHGMHGMDGVQYADEKKYESGMKWK